MTVSLETKIPELPAPEDILKKPSKDEFDKKMKDQDRIADEQRIIIEESRYKRKQVYDNGRVEGSNVTYKDLISGNIDDVKKFRSEKKSHLEKLNALKERQNELELEKQSCLKNIPRNYHNEQDLTQAIKEKQKKYETSSMSSVEEKKLLKDIDFLKKALPDMQKLSLITPQLN